MLAQGFRVQSIPKWRFQSVKVTEKRYRIIVMHIFQNVSQKEMGKGGILLIQRTFWQHCKLTIREVLWIKSSGNQIRDMVAEPFRGQQKVPRSSERWSSLCFEEEWSLCMYVGNPRNVLAIMVNDVGLCDMMVGSYTWERTFWNHRKGSLISKDFRITRTFAIDFRDNGKPFAIKCVFHFYNTRVSRNLNLAVPRKQNFISSRSVVGGMVGIQCMSIVYCLRRATRVGHLRVVCVKITNS